MALKGELRMNYFEKLEELDEKKRVYASTLSDNTYDVFENVIKTSIPLAIERYFNKESIPVVDETVLSFVIRDNRFDPIAMKNTGILEDEDSSIIYGRVNIAEFKHYMSEIPGRKSDVAELIYVFDTRELVKFYYEELQRIEYQTGKSR